MLKWLSEKGLGILCTMISITLVILIFKFAHENKNRASSEASLAAHRSPIEQGHWLFQTKGCIACHSADGEKLTGPTFKGIYGKMQKMSDGRTVMVDDAYIRKSIEEPQADIVEGFSPVMPSFKGLVTDEEIASIAAYIKSLQ